MERKAPSFFSWSGGKDSALCLYKALQSEEYSIDYLLTSLNTVHNRISMHGVRRELLQAQSTADAGYFMRNAQETFTDEQTAQIEAAVLAAYRWQYIISGVQHPHFSRLLTSLTTPAQMSRIRAALAPILGS